MSKTERVNQLRTVFTPRTPVQNKDLLAGRLDEVIRILTALTEPGLHVAIYGERGVGKSSLANVLSQFENFSSPGVPIRINCTTSDTFKNIWVKVLRKGMHPIPDDWAFGSPDPDEIRSILEDAAWPFIILDEFDRWEDDPDGLSLMADTVKALSDHDVRTKLVIVGVADSIDQLIGEHESVRRAIEEVPLLRMSRSELLRIPVDGLRRIGMGIDERAASAIATLSEGLPHFAHLLSQHAAIRCVQDDRSHVTLADVLDAIQAALDRHSVLKAYETAKAAQRRDTLYARVLLACALAEKDRLGFFAAADIREPMFHIMGRPYAIPAYAPHLKAFTEVERGPVLKREGPERRYRYRFADPLLQPFVVLTALSEGWLPEHYKSSLFAQVGGDIPQAKASPPNEPEQLF